MSNKYEKLIKLYYKKENIEDEYIKRIENPATFITDLKINPIKRGNKILNKEYNLFYVNLLEHTLLQQEIFENSNKILSLSDPNQFPIIAIEEIVNKILSNELYKTNKIEGIESSKSQIYSSLKENEKSNKKDENQKNTDNKKEKIEER